MHARAEGNKQEILLVRMELARLRVGAHRRVAREHAAVDQAQALERERREIGRRGCRRVCGLREKRIVLRPAVRFRERGLEEPGRGACHVVGRDEDIRERFMQSRGAEVFREPALERARGILGPRKPAERRRFSKHAPVKDRAAVLEIGCVYLPRGVLGLSARIRHRQRAREQAARRGARDEVEQAAYGLARQPFNFCEKRRRNDAADAPSVYGQDRNHAATAFPPCYIQSMGKAGKKRLHT